MSVVHLQGLGRASPQLPGYAWSTAICQMSGSVALHLAGLAVVAAIVSPSVPARILAPPAASVLPDQTTHMVFIARRVDSPGGGGGGGGNRQAGPIRRAEAIGHDSRTVRVKPASPSNDVPDASQIPALVLDATPLAAGTRNQVGLLTGGVSFGTSTGTGSGGGVGDGSGTGVGSGRGPGIGPGSGGGIGGGAYRPGGAVTSPRVISKVAPKYTDDALFRKIQGTVELELVVTRDGRPSDIRIIRSLDPGGLDERAVAAVEDWRFEPGRLAGAPVNVVVTVMLDFWIR
jgi:protein TonB